MLQGGLLVGRPPSQSLAGQPGSRNWAVEDALVVEDLPGFERSYEDWVMEVCKPD